LVFGVFGHFVVDSFFVTIRFNVARLLGRFVGPCGGLVRLILGKTASVETERAQARKIQMSRV
jgi:hypothetical protein